METTLDKLIDEAVFVPAEVQVIDAGAVSTIADAGAAITTMNSLICELDDIFHSSTSWEERKELIEDALVKTALPATEYSKYVHWNEIQPYTRNLVFTEGSNYNILILCWNAGQESRLHDHPTNGCFVVPLEGSL